jgi:uncharacterized protein DUF3105
VKLASSALERLAIVLAALALAIGLIAILSGFFQSRDQAGVSGSAAAIGQHFPDLGDAHLQRGELRPAYNSEPPTSGAHVPEPVVRDASAMSDNQLLEALEVGNVVIAYGERQPPPQLSALARSIAGPFTPALVAAGQAVILWHRPGTTGLIGLAWTRMLRVPSAADPALRAFANQWLGRGAPPRTSSGT